MAKPSTHRSAVGSRQRLCVPAAMAMAAAGVPGAAWAQSQPPGQTTQPDAPTQLDDAEQIVPGTGDIIVTAQRRDQRLQDVPVAISALSGETLVSQNVRTLEDLSAKVPGLVASTAQGYGTAPLAIRGISASAAGGNVFADQPVAIYVDGVSAPGIGGISSDLVDIESVQVLRGPQGTLFGRNATAGAILLTTAKPSFEPTAFVEGEVSSLGDVRGALMASGPLIGDTLAGRIVVARAHRDGYAVNLVDGTSLGGSEQAEVRGSLRWQPSGAFTSNLSVDYQRGRFRPITIFLADQSNLARVNPYVTRPDLSDAIKSNRFRYDTPQRTRLETIAVSWRNTIDLGSVSLQAITGYRYSTTEASQETDGFDQPLSFNSGKTIFENYSQELILNGETGRLNWTVGGYAARDSVELDPISIRNGFATFALGQEAIFRAKLVTDNYAGFVDGTYKVTDRLSLTVGGRYSSEKKDFDNDALVRTIRSGVAARSFGFGFVPPPLVGRPAGFVLADPPAVSARKTFTNFSPRAVLDYRFDDRVLGYASVTRGFKSGGFNAFLVPVAATDPVPSFSPEKITSYEVGLKSDLLDNRLRVNIAAYHYDYSDLQIRIAVPTGGVNIANAASARVNGIDLETVVRVTPDFEITGTAAVIDAKFKDGVLDSVPNTFFRFGDPISVVPVDITGNRLVRAPRFQAFVRGDYTLHLGELDLRTEASLRYQSRTYFLETEQRGDTYKQDGWAQVDLRATLKPVSGPWRISAYVSNLTNKRYITQVSTYSSLPEGTPNDPRRAGLQLRYDF